MTIACPECGAMQEAPASVRGELCCRLCDSTLELTRARSLDAALAVAAATFLLLFPAYTIPVARVSLLGAAHESYAGSGPLVMWAQGWPLLGAYVGLCGVVLPFVRFGLLTAALAAVRVERPAAWVGPAFRWAIKLETWAMVDVLVLGFFVAWSRLTAVFPVTVELGAAFFIAAGVLSLFSRAVLDKPAVWRAIAPDREAPAGEPSLSCPGCDLVLPLASEGGRCPRCAARLLARKPDSLSRTAALTTAGLLLYLPANIYPTVVVVQRWVTTPYNIVAGIRQIFSSHQIGLGLLVGATSFAIPLLKLLALAWFVAETRRGVHRRLRLKTRVYRGMTEIGRWSMADPFTLSFILPLTQYGELASSLTGAGSFAFTLLVMFTMAATETYDPRLAWDAAGARADARGGPVTVGNQ